MILKLVRVGFDLWAQWKASQVEPIRLCKHVDRIVDGSDAEGQTRRVTVPVREGRTPARPPRRDLLTGHSPEIK